MAYQTRLNPPPANGWVPPVMPLMEETPEPQGVARSVPRMKNLFESAEPSLFDDQDEVQQ